MLYRRFFLLTIVIAATAVLFVNVVRATSQGGSDLDVDERLKRLSTMEFAVPCATTDAACDKAIGTHS
ncbi:MAG: hypothetical protein OXR62_14450 [Ahrensia sp.]|nr:hypothetical protein [Ahrensia sp.]